MPSGLHFEHGDMEVRVRLIERNPRRQLEEPGDVEILCERRGVVDQVLSALLQDPALIGEHVRHFDRVDFLRTGIERIVDVAIRTRAAARLLGRQRAGGEQLVRTPVVRREVKRPRLGRYRLERRRVAPVFGAGAEHVVGNLVLQEFGLGAGLHRPVVPVLVQLVHVEQAGLAERDAADFRFRRPRSGVIPRSDDQIVLRFCVLGSVRHRFVIVGHCTRLIAVVLTGDAQDRHVDLRVLLRARVVAVPIRIEHRVRHPVLENRRGVADDAVDLLECAMADIEFLELGRPERAVGENLLLAGLAAGKHQPLHVVRVSDVVAAWKVDAGIRRRDRHDRRQVRRKFLGRGPLIVAGVGATPHRHLAIAVALLRQPFDDVVTIARLLQHRRELAFRIAAAAHVDCQVHVTVAGEIHAAVVVALRDVRRQREDARHRVLLSLRPVNGGIELHAVAQRNLHAPLKIDRARFVGGFRGCGRIRPERERNVDKATKATRLRSDIGSFSIG